MLLDRTPHDVPDDRMWTDAGPDLSTLMRISEGQSALFDVLHPIQRANIPSPCSSFVWLPCGRCTKS